MTASTDNQSHSTAKTSEWLVGSFAVAVAVATFAGATGGNINRIIRFYPALFVVAVLLLVCAVLAGVFAFYRQEKWLLSGGIVAFFVGVTIVLSLQSHAVRSQERPSISTTLQQSNGGAILKTTLRASALARDQYLFILVQGLNHNQKLDFYSATAGESATAPENKYFTHRIYKSRVGASPDGSVEATLEIPISAKLYQQIRVVSQILKPSQQQEEVDVNNVEAEECQTKARTSCATILIPSNSP